MKTFLLFCKLAGHWKSDSYPARRMYVDNMLYAYLRGVDERKRRNRWKELGRCVTTVTLDKG